METRRREEAGREGGGEREGERERVLVGAGEEEVAL